MFEGEEAATLAEYVGNTRIHITYAKAYALVSRHVTRLQILLVTFPKAQDLVTAPHNPRNRYYFLRTAYAAMPRSDVDLHRDGLCRFVVLAALYERRWMMVFYAAKVAEEALSSRHRSIHVHFDYVRRQTLCYSTSAVPTSLEILLCTHVN
jgi:hypothetical protein